MAPRRDDESEESDRGDSWDQNRIWVTRKLRELNSRIIDAEDVANTNRTRIAVLETKAMILGAAAGFAGQLIAFWLTKGK